VRAAPVSLRPDRYPCDLTDREREVLRPQAEAAMAGRPQRARTGLPRSFLGSAPR
jgi:hypothetical protein